VESISSPGATSSGFLFGFIQAFEAYKELAKY